MQKKVAIVGAGPAGLTAAIELQRAGFKNIVVFESCTQVGGISKTVNYKGNRIDIGGHRFFSKSDWVINWWADFMPIQKDGTQDNFLLKYKGNARPIPSVSTSTSSEENVLLIRSRLSRIYFNKEFFDYPLSLNSEMISKLGFKKTFLFGVSYMLSKLRPIKPEQSLQDFLINRFGKKLFHRFFKEYTEKVWGVPCTEISADWGAQRIKSLSITSVLFRALKKAIGLQKSKASPTSLIESFLYPKYGPGQMWQVVADTFVRNGGKIVLSSEVIGIDISQGRIHGVKYKDSQGSERSEGCDYLISTMPVRDLVLCAGSVFSSKALEIASGLQYRDFITVGLLYRRIDLPRELRDNWIYIQEPNINVGRVQVFNNWSPDMVANPAETLWLGLEYFCKESDFLWSSTDKKLIELGEHEMFQIGLVSVGTSIDATVLRVPKAYPGYFGAAFKEFELLRAELDSVANLFLVGRNGMHRYNNQDHSMLTAAEAARQIVAGETNKDLIWRINIDDAYQEQK